MTASIGRGHKRATDEQVIAAYQATRSVWKAAKQLGLAGQTVHERLRRLGIEPAHARWTSEEDAELRRLFGDPHLTAADVAKRLNRTSASVSCRAGELSIEKARAPKNKRIPRGKGYDKASVLKHLNRFSANEESISLTQYCRKNHLSIDNFAVATQKHYPLWWQEYCEELGLEKKVCPYCKEDFYPNSGKQRYCTRKCSSDEKRDDKYFSGNRRNAVGISEKICQICFKSTGDNRVHAHHVYGKRRDPDNEFLVALCSRCHMALEQLCAHADFDSNEQWMRLMRFVWMKRHGWEEENSGRDLKVFLIREVK